MAQQLNFGEVIVLRSMLASLLEEAVSPAARIRNRPPDFDW